MRRSPPPNPPLFTTEFFSTKSFGPGHVVGAGILAVGLYGIVKACTTRVQGLSHSSASQTALAQPANDRGQYGRSP